MPKWCVYSINSLNTTSYRIASYFRMVEIFVYFVLKSIIQKLKLRNYSTAIDSTSLSELYEYLNMKINIQIGRSCENYTLYGSLIVADSDFLM